MNEIAKLHTCTQCGDTFLASRKHKCRILNISQLPNKQSERERVEDRLYETLVNVAAEFRFSDAGRTELYKYVNKILSIKGLAILSENQELPEVPQYHQFNANTRFSLTEGYRKAQQDMKDFRRIVK